MNSRRGFLGAIFAAAMAPAVVKASSLMPIYVPKLWVPDHAEGDFTLESWFSKDQKLMNELRITQGVARYKDEVFVAPAHEWVHVAVSSATGLYINGVHQPRGPLSMFERVAVDDLQQAHRHAGGWCRNPVFSMMPSRLTKGDSHD